MSNKINEKERLRCAFCQTEISPPAEYDCTVYKCPGKDCTAVYTAGEEEDYLPGELASSLQIPEKELDNLEIDGYHELFSSDDPNWHIPGYGLRIDLCFGRKRGTGITKGYIIENAAERFLNERLSKWLDCELEKAPVHPEIIYQKIRTDANFWEIMPKKIYPATHLSGQGIIEIEKAFDFELIPTPTKALVIVIEGENNFFWDQELQRFIKGESPPKAPTCAFGQLSLFFPKFTKSPPKTIHLLIEDGKSGNLEHLLPIDFTEFLKSPTIIIESTTGNFLTNTLWWEKFPSVKKAPKLPPIYETIERLREEKIEHLLEKIKTVHELQ